MSQIEVSIYDQTEIFTSTPDIFSGDVGTDTVKFTFDSSWNTFDEKTAIFYNEPKKSYPVILDNTNIAVIPSEVIDRKITLYFGVIGTNSNGNVKTSSILSYRVERGAISADTEIPSPSTEVWLQILVNYEIALKKLNDMSNNLENMNNTLEEMDQRFIDAGVENKANKNLNNLTNDATNVLLSRITMANIKNGGGYYKSGYYIQAGTYNVTGGTASITFGTAYKDVPYVFVSYTTTESSNSIPTVTSRSKTGFTVKKGTTAAFAGFDWVAFGKI